MPYKVSYRQFYEGIFLIKIPYSQIYLGLSLVDKNQPALFVKVQGEDKPHRVFLWYQHVHCGTTGIHV